MKIKESISWFKTTSLALSDKTLIYDTIIFLFLLLLEACDFSCKTKTSTIDEAQKVFIKEKQIMTEKEALANEINYYKEPRITVKRKVRVLTGKDAIHECNLLEKENEEMERAIRSGRVSIIKLWNCYEEKKYAVDHPYEIVGAEYYFEGIFTHYNNGYETIKAKVLYIHGTWYVIRQYDPKDSNLKSDNTSQPSDDLDISDLDFSGTWITPIKDNKGGEFFISVNHKTSVNTIRIDGVSFQSGKCFEFYDDAIGWVNEDTLHVIQEPDENGKYFELTATLASRKTIEAMVRLRNACGNFDGKLIMKKSDTYTAIVPATR